MPISYFAKHLSGLRRALPRSLPIEIVILWTVVAECCFACGNPYLPIRIIHLLELVQVACTFLPSPTTVIEHLLLFLDPARAFKRTPDLSKSPFPDVLFSRGSTSPILDLDFLDGISGAYEVLGLNKDDKDAVVSECLQRTLSEEIALFDTSTAPCMVLGAIALVACARSNREEEGPSTPCPFDRIIAELYAFEAITLLDMYKRPVPGPLRRWSKKNRTPTGGILCPTIVLQWDSLDDGTVDGGAARVAGNDASSEQSGSARVVEGMVSNAYNNGKAPSSSCPSGKGHGRQSRRNGSHAAPVISSAGDSAQTSSDSTSVTSTALVLHAPTAGLPLPPLPDVSTSTQTDFPTVVSPPFILIQPSLPVYLPSQWTENKILTVEKQLRTLEQENRALRLAAAAKEVQAKDGRAGRSPPAEDVLRLSSPSSPSVPASLAVLAPSLTINMRIRPHLRLPSPSTRALFVIHRLVHHNEALSRRLRMKTDENVDLLVQLALASFDTHQSTARTFSTDEAPITLEAVLSGVLPVSTAS